ncbi:MAG: hypothetical protein GY827_03340 [Cytophagales bacterium]|nr:hypothetical protein [Cytophagales bacterium]
MENVTYTFQNVTENTYWDGSSFTGTLTDNTLCSDSTALGTDNSCNTIAQNISPTITHGNSYRMVVTATDEAGNSTTAAAIDYT